MKKQPYPAKLFMRGVAVGLTRRWYVAALAALSIAVRSFVPLVSVWVPVILFLVWLGLGIIAPLQHKLMLYSMDAEREMEELRRDISADIERERENARDDYDDSDDYEDNDLL